MNGSESEILSKHLRDLTALDALSVFRAMDVIPYFEDGTEALESFQPRNFFGTP
jgi:hypothetical protein